MRRGLAAATNCTTIVAASSPSARPLLLPQRRRALLLLRPAAAAAAAAAASTRSYSSHSRAHQQTSTSSGAAATAAAAAVTLLAAANAWGEDSAARQDAGTFHARMPSRPHRVVYSISTYPGNEYIEVRARPGPGSSSTDTTPRCQQCSNTQATQHNTQIGPARDPGVFGRGRLLRRLRRARRLAGGGVRVGAPEPEPRGGAGQHGRAAGERAGMGWLRMGRRVG